ncbi:SCO family protein [Sulfurospirillum sp. 1612]|uniref:SCO family protein n=1 Tax=Sulfurospirillum sp. 1612 TaxID=3094835 RepID=UPI002F94E9F1
MRKKLIIIFSAIVIIAGLVFVGLPYYQNQKLIQRYAFTMDSASGKVSLKDFKGKIVILYFGYMYCPDICPTTLSMVSDALHKLPKEEAKRFQLLFVSVDPDRDTLKNLKAYANYFYPTAMGLTSTKANLKAVSRTFGAYYSKIYDKGSKTQYTVAHTSSVYIINTQGILEKTIPHTEDENVFLKAFKTALIKNR